MAEAKVKEPITVIKRVQNGALLSNGLIRIEKVKLSFPHLDKPYKGDDDDGKPAFSLTAMLHKTEDNEHGICHKEVKDLIVEVMKKILEENEVKKLGADRKFIRDGDESSREEYEGCWTVSAREQRRPKVKNRKGETLLSEDDDDKDAIRDMFYSGCYATILVRPWFQDGVKVGKGFGMRINAGLVAVQFWKDGERLAGEGLSDDDIDAAMGGSDDDDSGGFDDTDDDEDL